MPSTFTAQLKAAEAKILDDLKEIATESIQDVMEAAQTPQVGMTKGNPSFEIGKIPVAEKELIDSLMSDGVEGKKSYVTAIAGFELGDTLTFEWTAPHAMMMELGFTVHSDSDEDYGFDVDVPGRHFVGFNAAKFSEFVAANEAKIK